MVAVENYLLISSYYRIYIYIFFFFFSLLPFVSQFLLRNPNNPTLRDDFLLVFDVWLLDDLVVEILLTSLSTDSVCLSGSVCFCVRSAV